MRAALALAFAVAACWTRQPPTPRAASPALPRSAPPVVAGPAVRGRVLFEGKPVEHFGVAFLPRDSMFRATLVERHARDGRFVVRDFAAGDGTIVIVAPGFARLQRLSQTIDAAKELDLGDLSLQRGFTVQGRVTDERGLPVSNARVVLFERIRAAEGNDLQRQLAGTLETTTDRSGAYTIEGFAIIDPSLGGAQLRASTANGARAWSMRIARSNVTADLVVHPTGTIQGTVGANLPERVIVVRSAQSQESEIVRVKDGAFELDVPQGDYYLSWTDFQQKATWVQVTVAAGSTVPVTLPP